MAARALVFLLYFVVTNSEYINRKFCENVDQSRCSIHNVKLDPCAEGPRFCSIRRMKPYRLSFDYTPRFEAEAVKLSLYSDVDNSGDFSHEIVPGHDACGYQTCPIRADKETASDMYFVYEHKAQGKFPIQMKLWNERNQTEACCFTFNVKIVK